MTEAQEPRLEELQEHNAPCLLWDGDRLRIVWANDAGLRLFGAETIFDLLDRAFEASEPGPALVRKLKRELGARQSRTELFEFPSAGAEARFKGAGLLYCLDDGRPGVLVVGEESDPARSALLMSEAFLALPCAAVLVREDGHLEHHNDVAFDYVCDLEERTLAGFLGTEAVAKDFAERVAQAGLVSEVRSIRTRLGSRDMRLAARRLGAAGEVRPFVLTIEDVTERRSLERRLGSHRPTAEERAAKAAEHTPESLPVCAEVPLAIRTKIESLEDAVAILREDGLLYANMKALALCKFPSIAAMRERADFVGAIASHDERVAISLDGGETICLEVRRSTIPWNKGRAMMARLVLEKGVEPVPAEAPKPLTHPAPAPPVTGEPTEAEALSWKPEDAELSAILDTASDGIITLDGEGRIRSFSAGAEAIFGQQKAMVLGRPLSELLTNETRKTFRDYLAALSDSGLATVFNDGREVAANVGPGPGLPLFLTISRLNVEAKDGASRPAFCAVVRDITQWKQTEAELREAKEKAEQTSRQKSEFLARISHELRTPLNAILGFSEVMRLERFGKLHNEKYRDYISDIHSSGAHLLSLINDLLDLSKVEAGKLELNFTSVSLPEVTEHATRLVADKAQQARVSVRRNFPPDLPNVVADLRSMRQIMINLLSNAIKFTDPGGQVMVSGRTNKAGELVLRVKDTGVGMTEEELKGALEPFRRVTSATRPEREGTGLGLPLTKALTEANRANFSISSEPGKGTVVEITYPTTRVLAD